MRHSTQFRTRFTLIQLLLAVVAVAAIGAAAVPELPAPDERPLLPAQSEVRRFNQALPRRPLPKARPSRRAHRKQALSSRRLQVEPGLAGDSAPSLANHSTPEVQLTRTPR